MSVINISDLDATEKFRELNQKVGRHIQMPLNQDDS